VQDIFHVARCAEERQYEHLPAASLLCFQLIISAHQGLTPKPVTISSWWWKRSATAHTSVTALRPIVPAASYMIHLVTSSSAEHATVAIARCTTYRSTMGKPAHSSMSVRTQHSLRRLKMQKPVSRNWKRRASSVPGAAAVSISIRLSVAII
jgi:uncharacterized membrane protein